MSKRVRIAKGNFVKADVSGTGDIVYGIVIERGRAKTIFKAADNGENVEVVNSAVTKVTEAEYNSAVAGEEAKPVAKKAPAKPKKAAKVVESDEDEDGEDDEVEVLIKPKMERYTTHDTVTASGRRNVDIADPVADLLRGVDLEDLPLAAEKVMKKLKVDTFAKGKIEATAANFEARYGHLNPGMIRMNIGNVIRAAMVVAGVEELPKVKV